MRKRREEVVLRAILRLGFAIAAFVVGGTRGGATLGDVAERDDGTERLARFIVEHRRRAELDGEARPVFAKERLFNLIANVLAVHGGVEIAVLDVARRDAGQRRMQQRVNFFSGYVGRATADHSRRRGVDERRQPLEIHAEHPLGRRIQNQLVLTAEPRELLRLTLDRFALPEQLDEDVHFRAKDVGIERLEDVVDGAELVTAIDVRFAAAQRGEEDDRRFARAFALAHERGGLEAVELGHLHVEQHDGKFMIEQMTQRCDA